jgi:branched-chain amino acid transport system permease protein
MTVFLQQIVEGVTSGGIYASLALALVLIYRATGVVNFGQGEMATFIAYVAWQLGEWGLPAAAALSASLLMSVLLGIVIFVVVVQPLTAAKEETIVITTLGLLLTLQAACLWIWGADQRLFFRLVPDGTFKIADLMISYHSAAVAGTVAALAIIVSVFFKLTPLGLAMRAAAAEPMKSSLVGIPVQRMLMFGWGGASAIGFVTAMMVAPKLFLSPTMMGPLLLYSLAAATVGGWTSPFGAFVGGMIVGIAESLGATYVVGSELRLAIPVFLALVILLIKPAGLFGRANVVRA